ncbi:MAG: dihydroorotate dehydrogenase [Elusimicrobia bacterium RIFCSPLOWO2_01_FULL_64_13]|nr:MAG: dihydroorotate dehydrogenase [Elusimicrobia bacterium RIFCSPHIGHO2_01_FULL_64_10]OGR97766.1 MAG: dihydroorotate dehydrogenase [Elusimicrobia bacterium RIFCSPLOWO2_01_FULL_64_13]
MDLSTHYLGLKLKSPLVPSASPLSEDVDNIKRMEDAGASAVVLHSLFEEQVRSERHELHHHLLMNTDSFAEALSFFPEPDSFHVGPEEYLRHVRRAKEAVGIPVIASLNGTSVGSWTDYAKKIQQAGADALELNIYAIPTDPFLPSAQVEEAYLDILKAVRSEIGIPISVKLSPFFSNFAFMARRLDENGAGGLVLFNRFYQPDIDLERLEVDPHHILFSTPQSLRLPLRWVAILHGKVRADIAASGGIHGAHDVLKVLMAGASVAMLCSVLLQRGIAHLSQVERDMKEWMEKHEYESVSQMRGSMSQKSCPDPSAFERAQYMRAMTMYRMK